MQCRAQIKSGRRCHNIAQKDSNFCYVHRNNVSTADISSSILTGIGVAVGHAIVPGLGGAIVGGLAGNFIGKKVGEPVMVKKKVFVSFDFDHDKFLREAIVGQARLPDSPFEISDWSMKEAAKEPEWEAKARNRILRSDIVLVIVGTQTFRAQGVLKEVRMARGGNIKIVQVKGYANKSCPRVEGAGTLYAWTWDNLKKLLS